MINFHFLWQETVHASEDGVKASHTHELCCYVPTEKLCCVSDLWLYHILSPVLCPFQQNLQKEYLKVFSSRVLLKTGDNCVPGSFEVPGFCHFSNLFWQIFLPTHPTTPHTCLRNHTHHYLFSICSCIFLQTLLMSLWQCNIWVLNEDTNIFWETSEFLYSLLEPYWSHSHKSKRALLNYFSCSSPQESK